MSIYTGYYAYKPHELKRAGFCKGCIYAIKLGGNKNLICNYLEMTGTARPCAGSMFSPDGTCECRTTKTQAAKHGLDYKAMEDKLRSIPI